MIEDERYDYRMRTLQLATEIVMNSDYKIKAGDSIEIDVTALANSFMQFVETGEQVNRG